MYLAVIYSNADSVKVLVKYGADVLIKDGKQRSLIEIAVYIDDIDIVSCLLATNKIDINLETPELFSLLHIAAQAGRLEMTKFLCDKGADINTRNEFGSKPIHHAAREGHIQIVEFYLNKGLSVNECAFNGRTLLHSAVTYNKNSHMVTFLHGKGAYINQESDERLTPLALAIRQKNEDIAKTMLSLGAVCNDLRNPFSQLMFSEPILNQIKLIKQLFKAVKADDYKRIEELILNCDAQALVNGKNDDDTTILHWASWKGHFNSVRVIMKYGGDPNIFGKNHTALHYAVKYNHYDIVQALLFHGAIYCAKCIGGKTPLDMTEEKIQKLF